MITKKEKTLICCHKEKKTMFTLKIRKLKTIQSYHNMETKIIFSPKQQEITISQANEKRETNKTIIQVQTKKQNSNCVAEKMDKKDKPGHINTATPLFISKKVRSMVWCTLCWMTFSFSPFSPYINWWQLIYHKATAILHHFAQTTITFQWFRRITFPRD